MKKFIFSFILLFTGFILHSQEYPFYLDVGSNYVEVKNGDAIESEHPVTILPNHILLVDRILVVDSFKLYKEGHGLVQYVHYDSIIPGSFPPLTTIGISRPCDKYGNYKAYVWTRINTIDSVKFSVVRPPTDPECNGLTVEEVEALIEAYLGDHILADHTGGIGGGGGNGGDPDWAGWTVEEKAEYELTHNNLEQLLTRYPTKRGVHPETGLSARTIGQLFGINAVGKTILFLWEEIIAAHAAN